MKTVTPMDYKTKKVIFTQRSDYPHWVGDAFPVRTLFSYNDLGQQISPFLLLDYAGPAEFPPTPNHRRKVGSHPHRGFETVTIVYDGEVEHRDSAGGGGVIGPGDVQWMTAASGLVHEESHGKSFADEGGLFEMVQLWVNLPKKYKMTTPRYQTLLGKDMSVVKLPDKAGTVKVIAGEFNLNGEVTYGTAKTFSPVNLWDVRMNSGSKTSMTVKAGYNTIVFVLSGKVTVAGTHLISDSEMAMLELEGEYFNLVAHEDSKILILNGEPFDEPVVGYGPFVMNSQAEIMQAMMDFNEGKMGSIGSIEGSD